MEADLALGRELTQKNNQSESSESEEDEAVTVEVKSENPWIGAKQTNDPLDEAFSGYKKFWEQHNANEKQSQKIKKAVAEVKKAVQEACGEEKDESPMESPGESEGENENSEAEDEEKSESAEDESESDDESDDENPSKFINDIFDEAEEKINSKMETKLTALKPNLLEVEKKKKKFSKKRGANVHDASYLGFEKKARLGDVDEALNEGGDDEGASYIRPSKKLLNEVKRKKEEKQSLLRGNGDINPESFLSVKSKHLITAIPKSQDFDDIDDEGEIEELSKVNKLSLAEAFEDDDIINDFQQEAEEIEKKTADDDAILPGWGNWGGVGVKAKKLKFEKKTPVVKKKARVIISSKVNEKLQKHLISSVPFPFKSVQDFEASMRLPIGRDFIPETAHRKLTLPSVVTKAGTVIEPMTEEILVQNSSGVKNKFEKRGKKGKKVRK